MIYWTLDNFIKLRTCEVDKFFYSMRPVLLYKHPYLVVLGYKQGVRTIRVYNVNDNSYNEYPYPNAFSYMSPWDYRNHFFDEYFGNVIIKDTTFIYPHFPGSRTIQIRAFNWMTGDDVLINSYSSSQEYYAFRFIVIDNSVPLLLEGSIGQSTLKALNPITFEVESTIMSAPYIYPRNALPYLFEVRDQNDISSYYKIDSSKQPLLLSSVTNMSWDGFILWNEEFSVYYYPSYLAYNKFVIHYYDGNTVKASIIDSGFSHTNWKFIPISKNEFICVEDFFRFITLSNVLKGRAVKVSKPNNIIFDELKIIAPHGMPTPETSVISLTDMRLIQPVICYRNGSYVKTPLISNIKYWVT